MGPQHELEHVALPRSGRSQKAMMAQNQRRKGACERGKERGKAKGTFRGLRANISDLTGLR